MELVFHGAEGTASVGFTGALGINIARGEIDAGGPTLAVHAQDGWLIGNLPVTRITCDGPVAIQLGDDAREFGTFTELVIAASTIWCREGLLAHFDVYTKRWHLDMKVGAERAAA